MVALIMAGSVPAAAQFAAPPHSTAPGEQYVVEFGVFRWTPSQDIKLRTETSGIIGTTLDFSSDLDVQEKALPEFRFVLKPGRRHKVRVSYLPIHYASQAVLERTIIFRGTTFRLGGPVSSDFEWQTWRFGYEFDVIARDRGYVGLMVEAKYTNMSLVISSFGLPEIARARLPIPALGGTFRVYPARALSLTGEVSGIALPGNLTEGEDSANYLDWDLYATLSLTRRVGFQLGYRSLNLNYRYNENFGEFKIEGIYWGAVVRF